MVSQFEGDWVGSSVCWSDMEGEFFWLCRIVWGCLASHSYWGICPKPMEVTISRTVLRSIETKESTFRPPCLSQLPHYDSQSIIDYLAVNGHIFAIYWPSLWHCSSWALVYSIWPVVYEESKCTEFKLGLHEVSACIYQNGFLFLSHYISCSIVSVVGMACIV